MRDSLIRSITALSAANCSLRPSRYSVEYTDARRYMAELARYADSDPGHETAHVDPAYYRVDAGFDTISEARKFAETRADAVIYERKNIRDVTPPGDPPGLLWEYETESVE